MPLRRERHVREVGYENERKGIGDPVMGIGARRQAGRQAAHGCVIVKNLFTTHL